jgi:hypothetical protein
MINYLEILRDYAEAKEISNTERSNLLAAADEIERLQKEHAELLYALKVIASHWPHWASQMNVKQIDLDAIALVRSAIAKGTPDAQA